MKSLYPLVAVILGGCCVAAFAAESPRPNIVLFLADDLGWADVPWHGSSYKLLHLDRLAAQGGKGIRQPPDRLTAGFIPGLWIWRHVLFPFSPGGVAVGGVPSRG